MSLPIYCNACGRLFAADSPSRRFCSREHAARFWGPRLRSPTQDVILAALREAGGSEVAASDLSERIYRVTDPLTRTALRTALSRLRSKGHAIATRCVRRALDREGETYYRLEMAS